MRQSSILRTFPRFRFQRAKEARSRPRKDRTLPAWFVQRLVATELGLRDGWYRWSADNRMAAISTRPKSGMTRADVHAICNASVPNARWRNDCRPRRPAQRTSRRSHSRRTRVWRIHGHRLVCDRQHSVRSTRAARASAEDDRVSMEAIGRYVADAAPTTRISLAQLRVLRRASCTFAGGGDSG